MKKRLLITIILMVITCGLITSDTVAYGYDFTFPAAYRYYISKDYGGDHLAYDYPFINHTEITAIKSGEVDDKRWDFNDGSDSGCNLTRDDRGNYIILDHGNGLKSWYFHLSRDLMQPGIGFDFAQGQTMAWSDDTGCSDGTHLHLAIKLNGTPFDPYADNEWVSNSPIPVGYRNQNGSIKGPYALSNSTIRNKWLDLEGALGSPISSVTNKTCPLSAPGTEQNQKYKQEFERGYIEYCVGYPTTVEEYDKVFLPNIRSRYSPCCGWNSTIIVRNNNSSNSAKVNITIYNEDGTVLDSRTYNGLAKRGIWSLDVWDVVWDASMGSTETFLGSAVVSASRDVSVVVLNRRGKDTAGYPVVAHTYTGVEPDSSSSPLRADTSQYLPVLYAHEEWDYFSTISIQNTDDATNNVRVEFFWPEGFSELDVDEDIPPFGLWSINLESDVYLPDDFFGTAIISSDEPVAVVVEGLNDDSDINMDYNALATGLGNVRLPYLMKNYYGWGSCFVVQNTKGSANRTKIFYYPSSGGVVTPTPFTLYGYQSMSVCQKDLSTLPDGVTLSGRVLATPNSIAVVVNQDDVYWGGNGTNVMSYSGIGWGSTTVVLPYLMRDVVYYNGYNNETWNSGIQVQNVGWSTTSVTIKYYSESGNQVCQDGYSLTNISQQRSKGVYLPNSCVQQGFYGSAILTANRPIIAVGNASCTDCNYGDTSLTYNGINR
jgi:hypothetical protein